MSVGPRILGHGLLVVGGGIRGRLVAFVGGAALVLWSVSGGAMGTSTNGVATEEGPPRWTIREDPALPSERVESIRRQADEALRWALTRATRVLGRRNDRVAIRWTLDFSRPTRTADGTSGASWGPRDLEAGATRWIEGGGLEVVIWGRRFLWNPAEIRTVVAHEVAHAHWASSLASQARYSTVPAWFREGLAIWLSGEGPASVDAALALATFAEGRADRCLRGLPPPGQRSREVSRTDAYLAIAWLESRTGTDGIRALAKAVAGGTPVDEAVQDLVGVSAPAFRAAVLVWGRERVDARLGPPREARFVDSLRLWRRGQTEEAAECWGELLEADPQGPLADTLHYLLAKHWLRGEEASRRPRLAEPQVRALVASSSTLWRAEALVLLGELLESRGRVDEARVAWTIVVDAYWDEPGPAGRAQTALRRSATPPPGGTPRPSAGSLPSPYPSPQG